jgi:hypothetical protein
MRPANINDKDFHAASSMAVRLELPICIERVMPEKMKAAVDRCRLNIRQITDPKTM